MSTKPEQERGTVQAPVRQRRRFVALSEARAVRDRLAEAALIDAKDFMTGKKAEARIEAICEAKGDYRDKLFQLQYDCFQNWDGNGIPDWRYLDDLGDAVEYIAEQESKLANKD